MSETFENKFEAKNDNTELCKDHNYAAKMEMATEYNLPMVSGDLIWPETYYWQNMMLAYYQMFNASLYNESGLNMQGDNLPTLNHLATSYNTEEANSNYG